jgi:hypothetical protein
MELENKYLKYHKHELIWRWDNHESEKCVTQKLTVYNLSHYCTQHVRLLKLKY